MTLIPYCDLDPRLLSLVVTLNVGMEPESCILPNFFCDIDMHFRSVRGTYLKKIIRL